MSYHWSKNSKRRMEGVHEVLTECVDLALSISKEDMTIPWMGGLRTAKDQRKIFDEGNSQLDGTTKKSYHQTGKALDVIPAVGGYKNEKGFMRIARAMFTAWQMLEKAGKTEGYTLEWGGFWTGFNDKPHWQIVK